MGLIGTDWDTRFTITDGFCPGFEPELQRRLLADGTRRRRRETRPSTSEIITILVAFQLSRFRDFKAFYRALGRRGQAEFPGLLSYRRFVALRALAGKSRGRETRPAQRVVFPAHCEDGPFGSCGPAGRRDRCRGGVD